MTRVLVIDDERDALEILEWVLVDNGCEVRTAETAAEALQLAPDFQADVVVTDYLLQSDATGLDVIRNLRNHQPALRAILMTGLVSDNLRSELSALGNIVVITKPFDSLELVSHIESAMAEREGPRT